MSIMSSLLHNQAHQFLQITKVKRTEWPLKFLTYGMCYPFDPMYATRPKSIVIELIRDAVIKTSNDADAVIEFDKNLLKGIKDYLKSLDLTVSAEELDEVIHIISNRNFLLPLLNLFEQLVSRRIFVSLSSPNKDPEETLLMALIDMPVDSPRSITNQRIASICRNTITSSKKSHLAFRLGFESSIKFGWEILPQFIIADMEARNGALGIGLERFFSRRHENIQKRLKQVASTLFSYHPRHRSDSRTQISPWIHFMETLVGHNLAQIADSSLLTREFMNDDPRATYPHKSTQFVSFFWSAGLFPGSAIHANIYIQIPRNHQLRNNSLIANHPLILEDQDIGVKDLFVYDMTVKLG